MGEPLSTGPVFSRIVSNRRLLWPGYVVVMCVVSALFFGSLKDHLLDGDDHEAFRDNIAMAEDFSFFFSSEKHQPGGRPLAELIKLAGYLVWGNDPGSFHLLVVATHTLAAILLGLLFWHQGMSLRTGLVGGLLFLVNVAHFRAVHWIAAIEFSLALSCGLGALLCYQHFLEDRRSRWLWGFYGGLVLGISALSAMALLWPFCLYWSWLKGHGIRASLRPLLPLLPVVALELGLILAITADRGNTWHAIDRFMEGDPFILILGAGRLLLWMLSRLLTTAHWLPIPLYEVGPWELYAGAGVLAGLVVLVSKSHLPVSLWSVWILLSILPFSLVTDTPILARPEGPSRYLYLATAGASLLLAWGLEEGSRRLLSWGRYLYGVLLAGILLSSYYYLKEAEAMAFYASGRNYIARGDFDTGVEQLKHAIDQGRDTIDLEDAYKRICYMGMGKEGAEDVLYEALAVYPGNVELNGLKLALDTMQPDSVLASRALQQLRLLKGREATVSLEVSKGKRILFEGRDVIERARRQIAGFFHNTGQNLGTGLVTLENLDRAILAYRRALEFDPDRTVTAENLVTALAHAGREEEAVEVAVRAVERSSAAPGGLLITASFGLLARGRTEEAIALCHRAVKDGSATEVQSGTVFRIYGKVLAGEYGEVSSASATRMGMDLLDGGRGEDAAQAFRQALDRDAANSQAHFGLALALLAQGQVAEGEQLYAEGVERFGAAGEESRAAEGLRRLIARGVQAEAARAILATHWPEQ